MNVQASLIVFSTTTPDAGCSAGEAARDITAAHPELDVLVGQPGDSLYELRLLARNRARRP